MIEETLLQTAYLKSPIGNLKITGAETGIRSVLFTDEFGEFSSETYFLTEALNELEEYFQGMRKTFNLKVDLHGTSFQKKIWNELLKIPYGSTISYIDLAIKHGDVKSIRAVGMANAKNPIAIIVPCHRVIGANGDLTGYAGGLQRKKWLLDLEGALQPDLFSAKKAL